MTHTSLMRKRSAKNARASFILLGFFTILSFSVLGQNNDDSLMILLRTPGVKPQKKAEIMRTIAKSCLTSDDKKAFAYADTALILAQKTGDKKLQAECYSMQGVVYKNRGEFQKAIEKQLTALKLDEEIKDTLGLSICYNHIGTLYKLTKNYLKALDYYRQANVLSRKINYGKGISFTYNNIGTAYAELLNTDSSIVYYKKALSVAEEIKNNSAISTACSNIGEYYGNKNMNKEALVYFNKCLQIDIEEENVYGMIMSYINLGGILTQMKEFGKAMEVFRKAEDLCVKNDEKPMLKDLYWSLSECSARGGNKEKAYDYLLKYKVLSEKLQTDEIERNILEMETKYQSERKDLEIAKNKAELRSKEEEARRKNSIIVAIAIIAVLVISLIFIFYRNQQTKQRARQAAELAAQKEMRTRSIVETEEKERIRIAKDLHDGVGQLLSAAKLNLSSLESKLSMKGTEQETAFKNAVDLLDESVKEVRAVSHNMMPNTLIKLGLASAVREFITKIQNTPDLKVNLEIVGMNERLEQEKESILYRVIQELISNIIKHAKATELTMQLIRHEKELSVVIEDNGRGFDVNKINDFEGIGLKNIISRVEFINGSVHFDSAPGKGTTVLIDVPIT